MTVTLSLTWWGILELTLWLTALGLGVFLLSRCYVAFRDYGYRRQRWKRQ